MCCVLWRRWSDRRYTVECVRQAGALAGEGLLSEHLVRCYDFQGDSCFASCGGNRRSRSVIAASPSTGTITRRQANRRRSIGNLEFSSQNQTCSKMSDLVCQFARARSSYGAYEKDVSDSEYRAGTSEFFNAAHRSYSWLSDVEDCEYRWQKDWPSSSNYPVDYTRVHCRVWIDCIVYCLCIWQIFLKYIYQHWMTYHDNDW